MKRFVLSGVLAFGVACGPMSVAASASESLTAGGSAFQPRVVVSTSVVVFECHAVAAGAVSVAIESCVYSSSSGRYSAPGLSSPGPVAATAGTGVNFDDGPATVCWTARAQFASGAALRAEGCATAVAL